MVERRGRGGRGGAGEGEVIKGMRGGGRGREYRGSRR